MLGEEACRGAAKRRGYAPLEFLLVLFPCILFFVLMFWMSAVAVNQPLAIIAARNNAWDKRFDQEVEPFEMDSIDQGRCVGDAERPIRVSHLVDDAITPRAEHLVYGGTWRSPHVDLNQIPNIELYKTTATKAGQQKVREISALVEGLQKMPSLFEGNIREMAEEQIGALMKKKKNLSLMSSEARSQLNSEARERRAESNAALDRNKQTVRDAILESQERISVLKAEAMQKREEIAELEDRLAKRNPQAADSGDKLDEEAKRAIEDKIHEGEIRVGEIEDDLIPNLQHAVEQLEAGLENLNEAGGRFD